MRRSRSQVRRTDFGRQSWHHSIAARHGFGRAERGAHPDAQRQVRAGHEGGALREYIEHSLSGYWFDEVAEDLPGLIRRLEEEAGLAETLGRAALRRYEEHFSLSIAMSAFENTLASFPCRICEGNEILRLL
jgi:hypothetical protein